MSKPENKNLVEVNLGEDRVAVALDKISTGERKLLKDKMVDVRVPFHLYTKYPMIEVEDTDEDGKKTGEMRMETNEEWQKRINEETGRKEGEEPKDHARRLLSVDDYEQQLYGSFNAITSTLRGKVYSVAEIETSNYKLLKTFVYRVLDSVNINADDFAPGK